MGKTFKQLPKEFLTKPVTKTITKLQRFRKIASVARRIKKKNDQGLKPKKVHEEEVEDYEQEENNESIENEELDQEIEENGNFAEEEEKQDEGNMEVEDNEDDDNAPKQNKPLTNLIKVLNPTLESVAIYTGGKIYLSPDNDLYCLCNNEIIIYSLETQTVKKKITQVKRNNYFIDFFFRKMKKLLILSYIPLISQLCISRKISF